MTALRPFWCYFGGKWRAAPRYPKPTHNRIVEPFAGAAGYSLRYPDHDVVLLDVDPIVAGLWAYLIRAGPLEILALPDLAPGQSVDDLAVCQEARWLIGFWLNKGVSSPRKRPSAWMAKWMADGDRPENFWGPGIRQRIASQVDRIRHWRVIHGSYEASPAGEATWFVDPPYQKQGVKHYRHHAVDYEALGEWCRSRPGQVMVCENEGADWLPFEPFATIKANEGRGGKRSVEVLWCQE